MEPLSIFPASLVEFCSVIAPWSLGIALAAGVFSLLVLGCTVLCRRSCPTVQNTMLMASLVGLLLLPFLSPVLYSLGFSITSIGLPSNEVESPDLPPLGIIISEKNAEAIPMLSSSEIPARSHQNKLMPSSLSPRTIILAFSVTWFVGIVVAFGRWLIARARLRQFRSRLPALTDPHIIGIWNSLAPSEHSNVLLLQGPKGISPMTFGVFSPYVVVPSDIRDQLSDQELSAVFAHELAHIQNRDALLGLFQNAITVFYWWNPIIHLLQQKLTLLREMMSDRAATTHIHPATYASSLLRLAERKDSSIPAVSQAYGAVFNPVKHPLEQRFRMLSRYNGKSDNQTMTMKQHITLYAAMITITCLCAAIHTSVAQNTEPSRTTESDRIDTVIADQVLEAKLPHPPTLFQAPQAPAEPESPAELARSESLTPSGREMDHLKQQLHELQKQVEDLMRDSKSSNAKPKARQVEGKIQRLRQIERPVRLPRSKSDATVGVHNPSLTIRVPRGEGHIELNTNGVLIIGGPNGRAVEVDMDPEMAKSFTGIIENAIKSGAHEMEKLEAADEEVPGASQLEANWIQYKELDREEDKLSLELRDWKVALAENEAGLASAGDDEQKKVLHRMQIAKLKALVASIQDRITYLHAKMARIEIPSKW